jgi:hypothetical protein
MDTLCKSTYLIKESANQVTGHILPCTRHAAPATLNYHYHSHRTALLLRSLLQEVKHCVHNDCVAISLYEPDTLVPSSFQPRGNARYSVDSDSSSMKRCAVTRYKGISKKAIIHTSQIGGRVSTVLTSGKQDERKAAAEQKRRAAIQRTDFHSSSLCRWLNPPSRIM